MGHVLEGLQESGMEMISAFIGTLFEHLKVFFLFFIFFFNFLKIIFYI